MYPKHMMRQTVTLYSGGTTDDYGQTTNAAGVDHAARVELVNKVKPTRDGQAGEGSVGVIALKAWIGGDVSITEGARIDYDGTSYKVAGIEKVPDGAGTVRMTGLECIEWR